MAKYILRNMKESIDILLISMQIPFMQMVLSVEPIPPTQWLQTLALGATILVCMEVFKFINSKL
ncbi:MAG: hypothetical protein APF76_16625 [Desulfitibacter sp. BRH_c19]|nr:MAG: hypothetical protein APF76_16625 [Desulfitibacter sp. BRH_c19]